MSLASNIGLLPISGLTDHTQQPETCVIQLGIGAHLAEPLPRYSPNLRLELLLPDAPVLSTGAPIRLRLKFYVPPELLNEREVYIRSVIAHLRSKITAKLGPVTRSAVRSSHVCSARGLIPVTKTDFEVDMGAWGGCIILDAHPSFQSCGLDLAYSLEVAAGISVGKTEDVRVSLTQNPSPHRNPARGSIFPSIV